jgi:uncharacterized protein (DUF1778 family)
MSNRTPTKTSKTERMELRVRPAAKQAIRRAMAISGLSAGDLAFEGAKHVLAEHERLSVSGRDAALLLDLLENPPEPNQKLKRAALRYRKLAG